MWEWAQKKLQNGKSKKTIVEGSLIEAYDDILETENFLSHIPKPKQYLEENTHKNKNIKDLLMLKIEEMGLKNLNLIEYPYNPQTWQEMTKSFGEYERTRNAFLKLLGYNHGIECIKAGLNINDLELMKEGITPENYNTHLKVPFDFGGSIDFSNLCLIKSHPTHDYIHSLIDLQIEQGYLQSHNKIYIPYMEGKIYYD